MKAIASRFRQAFSGTPLCAQGGQGTVSCEGRGCISSGRDFGMPPRHRLVSQALQPGCLPNLSFVLPACQVPAGVPLKHRCLLAGRSSSTVPVRGKVQKDGKTC